MKRFFLIIITAFFISNLNLISTEKNNIDKSSCQFHLIRISYTNQSIFDLLILNGFDTESLTKLNNGSFELITNSFELDILDSLNIDYSIIIKDLESYIENNLKKSFSKSHFIFENNFQLGSMSGFYTYQETSNFFDTLINRYPLFFRSIDTIGYSLEGRPLLCYSFSTGKKILKDEVLYTSLLHAREPSGLMVLCYFISSLLEKASKGDKEALYLLDKNIIYMIPIANPDGYVYNQKIKPNGGGLWRKNRRLNQDSSYGVDLNRNFGTFEFWNSSNMGSSTNPKNETYRGIQPFSEPETQAIRNFCNNHNIRLAINYHSYGNYLLFPYSALMKETPDSSIFRAFSMFVSKNSELTFGRDYYTVGYYGRGTSDDWMYESFEDKNSIIAYTLEVGRHRDGFWPSTPERIYEQCLELFNLNKEILWSAEVNLKPTKIETVFDSVANNALIKLTIQNIGLDEQTYSSQFSIRSLNDYIIVIDSLRTINFLKPSEEKTIIFNVPFPKKGFKNGSVIPFEIKIIQNNIVRLDTLFAQLWLSNDVYLYKAPDLDSKWELESWGQEYDIKSTSFVLADSPLSLYQDSTSNYLTWTEPINLKCINASLDFETHWEIEARYDFGIIQISTDMGKTWENLKADRMVLASAIDKSRQTKDSYGYAGFFPDWIQQSINLRDYLGKKILLRFALLSDVAKHYNGWFIKNIRIRFYNELDWTSVEFYYNENNTIIHQKILNRSNPLNIEVKKNTLKPNKIIIYNLIGKVVFSDIFASNYYKLLCDNFISGIYFIEIYTDGLIERGYFILQD